MSLALSATRNSALSSKANDWITNYKRKQEQLNSEEQNNECGGPLAGEASCEFDIEFEAAVQKALHNTLPEQPVCANDDFFGFGNGGAGESAAPKDLPPGLVVQGNEYTQSRQKRDVRGRGAQHVASQPPMCDALTSMPAPDSWWMSEDNGAMGEEVDLTEEEDVLAQYLASQLRGCGSCGLRNFQTLPAPLRLRVQYYMNQNGSCCSR
jgi:hypothetical protein